MDNSARQHDYYSTYGSSIGHTDDRESDENRSSDFEHINTNNSWRDSEGSPGKSISGDLRGRVTHTETSPLLNDDANNNQDDINEDGQTLDDVDPSVTPFTLIRRHLLYVASVIISAGIATGLTLLISNHTNKDHGNVTPGT